MARTSWAFDIVERPSMPSDAARRCSSAFDWPFSVACAAGFVARLRDRDCDPALRLDFRAVFLGVDRGAGGARGDVADLVCQAAGLALRGGRGLEGGL